MKLIQFGIPRSGTTVVHQILTDIFTTDDIIKTHAFVKGADYVFIPIRDLRNCVISWWRASTLQLEKCSTKIPLDECKYWTTRVTNHIPDLAQYMERYTPKQLCILRYEDFVDDLSVIFRTIEYTTGIKINMKTQKRICRAHNMQANIQIQRKFHKFDNWDEQSGIHAFHIGTAEHTDWKVTTDAKSRHYMYRQLAPYLTMLGYTTYDTTI